MGLRKYLQNFGVLMHSNKPFTNIFIVDNLIDAVLTMMNDRTGFE